MVNPSSGVTQGKPLKDLLMFGPYFHITSNLFESILVLVRVGGGCGFPGTLEPRMGSPERDGAGRGRLSGNQKNS